MSLPTYASNENPAQIMYVPSSGVRAAKALVRLRIFAGSSVPSLLAYTIGIKIPCAGYFYFKDSIILLFDTQIILFK